jgi:ABC-type iron transport system FetAB ATPase subunit
MSQAIFWTAEGVAAKADEIYQSQIRSIVETPDNIGKMLKDNWKNDPYF